MIYTVWQPTTAVDGRDQGRPRTRNGEKDTTKLYAAHVYLLPYVRRFGTGRARIQICRSKPKGRAVPTNTNNIAGRAWLLPCRGLPCRPQASGARPLRPARASACSRCACVQEVTAQDTLSAQCSEVAYIYGAGGGRGRRACTQTQRPRRNGLPRQQAGPKHRIGERTWKPALLPGQLIPWCPDASRAAVSTRLTVALFDSRQASSVPRETAKALMSGPEQSLLDAFKTEWTECMYARQGRHCAVPVLQLQNRRY